MKVRSDGRGNSYSISRGIVESTLRVAYRGDWPARLWGLLPAARTISVNRHRLTLPPGGGDPCRVAFISDLHIGPTTPLSILETAFDSIRSCRPHVVLLGGDYVFLDAEPHRLAVLSDLVKSVACEVTLAVLGNHDLWSFDEAIVKALSDAGAKVLVNEVATLPSPWADVAVLGLDDPWTGRCDPQLAMAQFEDRPVRIVLCHSPDGLSLLSGLSFDLFLCGHTHGGQIAAPWGPIVLPYGRMCRDYPSGFRQFGSSVVYVSRGVGAVELPIRTFAPPDILLLELIRQR